MTGPSFKTMYLVSKSDLENNKRKKDSVGKDFKLSLQNQDICDGGMSVSVKPIKARVRNKQRAEKPTQLDDSESEDEKEKTLTLSEKKVQQYPYAKPTEQTIESNPSIRNQHPSYGFRSGNQLEYINDDVGDDNENKTNDPVTLVESNRQDLTNNGDRTPSNIYNFNNNQIDTNEDESTASNIDNNNNISNADDDGESDKTEPRSKRLKHRERVKGYQLKRLQKKSKKRMKNRIFNKQGTKAETYRTEPPFNQNDNHSTSQGGNRDSSEGEDIQMRHIINDEHKTDEVDHNQRIPNLKKRKILDDIQKSKDDQWLGRIKSRLNDKRVQFKRKQDTIGYRINPDDISKSLIKPSDFTYLSQPESADYLDKWKSLKELKKKPFKNKRFKLYH